MSKRPAPGGNVSIKIDRERGRKNIGGGINNNPGCQVSPPSMDIEDENYERESELQNVRIWVRNCSASYLTRWSWYEGVGMWFVELVGTFIFAIFQLSGNYVFPGAANSHLRALIIAAAAFIVKATAGRFTSAHLDPFRTIGSTVSFVFTRGNKMSLPPVWIDVLKLLIFLSAQWIAWMLALVALGLWTGTDIKTSDCLGIPTPAVCDVYPVRDVFVTVSSLDWMEALGGLFLYGIFVWGERAFGWFYPNVIISALFYGGAHFLTHLLWSQASGGSFNFWYWSMTAWFSNISDPNNGSYIWPGIVAVGIVVIIDILVYYVVARIAVRLKEKDNEEKNM